MFKYATDFKQDLAGWCENDYVRDYGMFDLSGCAYPCGMDGDNEPACTSD